MNAGDSDPPVRLQFLLRSESRSDRGRRAAADVLRKLNLEVTGRGLTSISARAPSTVVAAVFGLSPDRPASWSEPDLMARDLPVPAALAEHVERVSIAPPHETMSEGVANESERDEEGQ